MAQARMIESLAGEQIAQGMQLSVICAEDADRLRVDPADAATLMGAEFVASMLAQCEVWPKGRRPPDFNDPVRSDRPVLLLSGELDPSHRRAMPRPCCVTCERPAPRRPRPGPQRDGGRLRAAADGALHHCRKREGPRRRMPRPPRAAAARAGRVRLGSLNGAAMIEVKGLRKSFTARGTVIRAVDDVSFEAHDGEITACSGRTAPARRPRCACCTR